MSNILVKQFYKQRSDFEKSCAGRDSKYTFPEGCLSYNRTKLDETQ